METPLEGLGFKVITTEMEKQMESQIETGTFAAVPRVGELSPLGLRDMQVAGVVANAWQTKDFG